MEIYKFFIYSMILGFSVGANYYLVSPLFNNSSIVIRDVFEGAARGSIIAAAIMTIIMLVYGGVMGLIYMFSML